MEAHRPLGWSTRPVILAVAIALVLALATPAGAAFKPIAEWGSPDPGEMILPIDVERDDAGNTYVVDALGASVTKFDAANNPILSWGSSGSGLGEFALPVSIGVNEATGQVYVADLNESLGRIRIQRFDSSGNPLGEFGSPGTGEGQFAGLVRGIAVNSGTGDVYVAEDERVQRFSSTGQFELMWGRDVDPGGGTGFETCAAGCKEGESGDAAGELSGAEGIATAGNWVFVSESSNRRISRYNATTGAFQIMAGLDVDPGGAMVGETCVAGCQAGQIGAGPGELNAPRGLDANLATGRLYIVDQENDRVQRWSTGGLAYQTEFGSAGAADGQFGAAEGLAENQGRVTVTDQSLRRVQSFDANGVFQDSFGTPGPGTLVLPRAIGVGAGGVYVTDSFDRVLRFDPNGAFLARFGGAGATPGQFDVASGVAVAADGSVYVADLNNDRVQRFDASGTLLDFWGSTGVLNGQFSGPIDVAVGQRDSVYAVEASGNRVQRFGPTGAFEGAWGGTGDAPGKMSNPQGLAADPDGNVYVADTGNHRIQKFSPEGSLLTAWGTLGNGDGQFAGPFDVAADGGGNVFVADMENNRIQRFDANGAFRDRWGANGGDGTIGGGPGEFYAPSSIAVDAPGYVYVVDSFNGRVQKFAAEPELALKGKRKQRLDRIKVKVRCKAGPCNVRLAGKVKVKPRPGAGQRPIKLKRRELSMAAGQRTTVKLKLRKAKRSARRLTALLEDGSRAKLKVRGVAGNEAGEGKAKRRIKLRARR